MKKQAFFILSILVLTHTCIIILTEIYFKNKKFPVDLIKCREFIYAPITWIVGLYEYLNVPTYLTIFLQLIILWGLILCILILISKLKSKIRKQTQTQSP
jgi:hypothetical protein